MRRSGEQSAAPNMMNPAALRLHNRARVRQQLDLPGNKWAALAEQRKKEVTRAGLWAAEREELPVFQRCDYQTLSRMPRRFALSNSCGRSAAKRSAAAWWRE
eukprot:scaffold90_cov264-Pinguiococcus_pyrenoidosus.AAC.27